MSLILNEILYKSVSGQKIHENELNNLSSINLDISGNTASLSFEGNIPPPSQDDVD